MQIQMTTDYAIRILTYLAAEESVTSSTELAKQLSIPQKYVASIGYKLRDAHLAGTVAGPKGGYVCTRPPEDISLYDIIEVFESGVKINRCLEDARICSRNAVSHCVVHDFFQELQEVVEQKLKSETLATLQQRDKCVKASQKAKVG